MRIDSFNSSASQLSGDVNPSQVSAQGTAQSSQASQEDRATLTSDSTSLSSLVSQALNTPDVRQSKIDSLTQSINSGDYELDPAKIAASMVDEYA